VGATENVMIAACKAKGFTYIHNAAKEPEIEDLQRFLNAMGCRVSGAGTTTVTVEGVPELHDAEHSVIPDRIVAATLLCAAAAAGGDITLTQAEPGHFTSVCACLQEAGCELSLSSERVRLRSDGKLRRIQPVRTAPYPGFPTDAQAPLMAVMAKAKGCSVFVENMFLGRYRHVDELVRMGAEIQVADRVAVIMGRPALYGAQVEATDLRGGAALVVAGLAAEGQTVVGGVRETIDRGYERLEDQLTALGADVKRI
jgi:UDP-N-acetylglucosamine 1-carboxyvinyltransferase